MRAIGACGWLVWACAAAATPDDNLDRIHAERAAAIAKFGDQERACQSRFVVTSCVEAARKEQRATLTRLDRQLLLLNEAKRREAAASRSQLVRDKTQMQQARASEADPAPSDRAVRPEPKPNPVVSTRTLAADPLAAASSASRRAVEQKYEAKFEDKARAAQAHREAVEQHNAERAARGGVAAPLPVPSAASAR